ncbi:hypothetical protein JHK86_040215 [Glycine max]|nr:hypothetical protein JHK86_040215 [Glycine max]
MFDPRRNQPTISFPLSNEIGQITHGYDTWGATNTDFMASKKPPKNYKNCHSYNDMEVQLGTGSKVDDNESGICSPPLWTTNPPKSPHHRKNYYRCLSPASKTQAIARGQRELMEMVKNMPESSYELSLKDLVEHPRVEVAQEKGAEERKKLGNKNVGNRKKVDMNKKGQVKRSGNIDSGGFYLKMVFPISLGFKKKTKNESLVNSGSNKVSPRTSVSDGSKSLDKEWWKKSLSASGGESDSGVSSINSGSKKSSGSSNSSSSSRSNSSGSSSKETHHGVSNSKSPSSGRLTVSHRAGGDTAHLRGRAQPSATSLVGEPILVTMNLPPSVFGGARRSGKGGVRASSWVRCSHSVGLPSSPLSLLALNW